MIKDWRGTPITVGSLIVYPCILGQRVQSAEARVVEILLVTQEIIDNNPSYYYFARGIGEVFKIKIHPTGRTSRFQQHGGIVRKPQRHVWLSANAGSVTVIGDTL